MPINLMSLSTSKGPLHINPANIASAEPAPGGGTLITFNTDRTVVVTEDHQKVVSKANTHSPDGF